MQVLKKRMNKKGQFYIIAAFVIILLVFGFVNLANKISGEKPVTIYRLKEEIILEKLHLLDYAMYNNFDDAKKIQALKNFSLDYINSSKENNFYFIYGNKSKLGLTAYQKYSSNITLNITGNGENHSLTANQIFTKEFTNVNDKIYISLDTDSQSLINPISYEFSTNNTIDLHFIISAKEGNEVYLIRD